MLAELEGTICWKCGRLNIQTLIYCRVPGRWGLQEKPHLPTWTTLLNWKHFYSGARGVCEIFKHKIRGSMKNLWIFGYFDPSPPSDNKWKVPYNKLEVDSHLKILKRLGLLIKLLGCLFLVGLDDSPPHLMRISCCWPSNLACNSIEDMWIKCRNADILNSLFDW